MKLFINALFTFLLSTGVGRAEEFRAHLIYDSSPSAQFLTLETDQDTQEPVVVKRSTPDPNDSSVYFVRLKGKCIGSTVSLVYRSQGLAATGSFTIEVPITGVSQKFTIFGVDDYGKLLQYDGEVEYSQYNFLEKITPSKKKFSISPELGFSSISSQQSGVDSFSQLEMWTKLGTSYSIEPEKWNVSADIQYTLLPLTSNISNVVLRSLSFDFRGGRTFAIGPSSPWKIQARIGWAYVTTFATNDYLGFKDAYGPEISPVLEYGLSDKKLISIQFKYTPFFNGGYLFLPNNSEFAIGADYSVKMTEANHWLKFSIHFSSLGFALGATQIYLNRYDLSGMYQFRF